MRLFAKDIGYLCCTESFNAVVHSVFASALNISKSLFDVPFLCLFDRNLPMTPTAVRIDAPQYFVANTVFNDNLLNQSIFNQVSPGDDVYCRAGILRISNHAQSHTVLEIDLRTACQWDMQLFQVFSTPEFLFIDSEVKSRFDAFHHIAMQALNAKCIQSSRFSQKSDAANTNDRDKSYQRYHDYLVDQQLMVSTVLFSMPFVILENIGKGKGLTPSGDDLICGLLAVLHSVSYSNLGVDKPIQALITQLALAIKVREHKTTSISRHYLDLAVQGHFSAPVIELLMCAMPFLFNPDRQSKQNTDEIRLLLNKLLAIGNQSGADTLSGMLYGFEQLILLLEASKIYSL